MIPSEIKIKRKFPLRKKQEKVPSEKKTRESSVREKNKRKFPLKKKEVPRDKRRCEHREECQQN